MYTLLVCADLFGEKINLEITFSAMPTIGELQRKIIECYTMESQAKRPPGYPNIEFSIARLQIYDDVLLKWTDLVTCTQLHEYDQLYAFQPQSPWHIDVQKDLPPPRPPTNQMGSSSRAPPAAPPTPAGGDYTSSSPAASYKPTQASPAYGHDAPSSIYGGAPTPQQAQYRPDGGATRERSPASERLEQQKRREEALRAELSRVHEETMRLEQIAAAEAEEERRRSQEEKSRTLRQREAEIARQRELLRQMEEEYRGHAEGRG